MITLLMVAGGMSIVSATTALWMNGRQMLHQRVFALLVSFTVTVVLFSLIAWAAVLLVAVAPLPVTFVGAQRVYRDMHWSSDVVLSGMLAVQVARTVESRLRYSRNEKALSSRTNTE